MGAQTETECSTFFPNLLSNPEEQFSCHNPNVLFFLQQHTITAKKKKKIEKKKEKK